MERIQTKKVFAGIVGQNLLAEEGIKTPEPSTEGERKHVTVLFSDLSGYTNMSEKLDPEDVKEITDRIFDGVSKIVSKYDGFIEKYAGDAFMALTMLGVLKISKGYMRQGIERLNNVQRFLLGNECPTFYAQSEYVFGNVYLQIVVGAFRRMRSGAFFKTSKGGNGTHKLI
jgi:hypothetical protein